MYAAILAALHLDDATSKLSAGVSSTAGGFLAYVADSPLEQVAGLAVAIVAPLLLGAFNRWVDRRYQDKALRASLAAAEQVVSELRAELARRDGRPSADALPSD